MNSDGWEDYDEGPNELILSPWLIEWEEAAPSIADDPDEPDTLVWPDEEAALDWAAWERDYETGEPFRRVEAGAR